MRLLRALLVFADDPDSDAVRRAERVSVGASESDAEVGAELLPARKPAVPPMTRAATGARTVAFIVSNVCSYF